MPRKRKHTEKILTSWAIKPKTYRKLAVYKELHGLNSLETAANDLLEKATTHIEIPEGK